jgi:hypothetical protein
VSQYLWVGIPAGFQLIFPDEYQDELDKLRRKRTMKAVKITIKIKA